MTTITRTKILEKLESFKKYLGYLNILKEGTGDLEEFKKSIINFLKKKE